MPRLLPILCLCGLLPGCLAAPRRPEGPSPPPEMIRLFGEDVTLTPRHSEEAVQDVIRRHVVPGMPLAEAQAALERERFVPYPSRLQACLLNQRHHPLGSEKDLCGKDRNGKVLPFDEECRRRCREAVSYQTTRDVFTMWGQRYVPMSVTVVPDRAGAVQEVYGYLDHVGTGTVPVSASEFFSKHQDLKEPVGLPAEQAQAYLKSFGFKCVPGPDGGKYLLRFEAINETILGGGIVRIQLFLDAEGVVRDSEILEKGEWPDYFRVLLPAPGDPPAECARKLALAPVRVAAVGALGILWGSLLLVASMGTGAGHY